MLPAGSLVGTTLGNIRIDAPLGVGGMGEVYLGFHLKLQRRVAIKTIRSERRLSPAAKARLLREAQVLSRLGHPGICQVHDLVETPEADFLVLELIEGKTLAQVAAVPPPHEELLRIAEEIAAVLAVAHGQQIVHRDVKPENVMVTPKGAVKMLDFGLARPLTRPQGNFGAPGGEFDSGRWALAEAAPGAGATVPGGGPPPPDPPPSSSEEERLTVAGTLIGTVLYMSPEQARGEEATTASDVYALGVMLQELFTRKSAYAPGSTGVLLGRVSRAETLPAEGVDPDLARLLESMEELAPEDRPTAEQVATRLHWIRERPQRQRRQRLQLVAAAAVVAVLAIGLAVVSYLALAARRSRDEAERRRRQADGLIGFMLEDLRPKLEGVGRLDLLDAVGERALAYYATVPEGLLTDEELDRREQAVRHLAQVHVDQGKLDAALGAARQSMRMAAALTARDPGKASWQSHLAEARGLVGYVLYSKEVSLPEARSMMESGRDIYLRLVAAHRANPEWKRNLISAYLNVGAVCEAVGDVPAALAAQHASIDLALLLLEEHPEDGTTRDTLTDALGFYSTSLEQSGDLRGAVDAREQNMRLLERKLAREPKNAVAKNDLSVSHSYLAGLLIGRGDLAAAEAHQRASLAIGESLADPGNATWRSNVATTRSNLGQILLDEGRPAEALPLLDSTVNTFAPLHTTQPENAEWRRHLAAAYTRRGRIFGVLARFDEGRRDLDRARTLYEGLVAANPGGVVAVRFAELAVARGELEARSGNRAVAEEQWNEALRRLPPLGRRADHRSLSLRARVLLYLHRPEEAKPLLEKLRAMGGHSASLMELAKEEGIDLTGK